LLALSTSCAPPDLDLDRAVAAFHDLRVRAVALHRAARPEEASRLARQARRVAIVAVWTELAPGDLGRPILVVDGGPAAADREASLEALCRRLHALREFPVALRTPAAGETEHPAPFELALVHEAARHVGYWHDATRGGAAYLDAAGPLLRGASFHPLHDVDLVGLRDALPAAGPAVVDCPGASRVETVEALRRARGVFGD